MGCVVSATDADDLAARFPAATGGPNSFENRIRGG